MTYFDTSFLLALYVEGDSFHVLALKLAAKLNQPIPFTLLTELELVNGIRRSLVTGIINKTEHDLIFRQISEDEADGILFRKPLPQAEHFAKARELSKKFTPETSSRTLDILHVAAALLLQSGTFVSFDKNQMALARKTGMKILP